MVNVCVQYLSWLSPCGWTKGHNILNRNTQEKTNMYKGSKKLAEVEPGARVGPVVARQVAPQQFVCQLTKCDNYDMVSQSTLFKLEGLI